MPEDIQGWELFAVLSLRGEKEFRTQIADINRLIDDTQKKMSGLGGPSLGSSVESPNFAPLGGGPTPGIPGNFSGGGGKASFGGSKIPMGAIEQLARKNMSPDEFTAAFGGNFSNVASGGGGGWGGFRRPPAPEFPNWYQDPKSPAPGAQYFHKFTEDPKSPAPGVKVGWTEAGTATSGGTIPAMGQELVGESKRMANALKETTASTKLFGLHQMWVIRAATAGGAAGVAGGALGYAIGAIPSIANPAGGALMGNFIGQSLGSQVARNDPLVEMGNPGMAFLREQAKRDREAAEGRQYRGTYAAGTALERQKADFYASGGLNPVGALRNIEERVWQGLEWVALKLAAKVQGIEPTPGAGVGLAPSPLGGKGFSSVADFHNAAIGAALAHGFGGDGMASGSGFMNFFASILDNSGMTPEIRMIMASRLNSTGVE